MNCYLHPDTQAVAYCRACGRALCSICQRTADGTVFCQEHAPQEYKPQNYKPMPAPRPAVAAPQSSGPGYTAPGPNPYVQPPGAATAINTSPGLAFLLGWIPGVGAIYNGQYMKGLVHAILFGLLISLIDNAGHSASEPLLAIMMAAYVFYMPFEAYHTAKKRQLGIPVDEWSSIVAHNRFASRTPVGPILLIGLGVLFLLDTLNLIEFRELARFWPILLIVVGAFMLYNRVKPPVVLPPQSEPFEHTIAESPHE